MVIRRMTLSWARHRKVAISTFHIQLRAIDGIAPAPCLGYYLKSIQLLSSLSYSERSSSLLCDRISDTVISTCQMSRKLFTSYTEWFYTNLESWYSSGQDWTGMTPMPKRKQGCNITGGRKGWTHRNQPLIDLAAWKLYFRHLTCAYGINM